MTPLAHFITKQLTLPIKRRRFSDGCQMLKNMSDIHCFECSEIMEAVRNIISDMADRGGNSMVAALKSMISETGFLPSPKTWIEFSVEGYRLGFLLVADEDNCSAKVFHAFAVRGKIEASASVSGYMTIPLINGVATIGGVCAGMPDLDEEQQAEWILQLIVLLAFINTPRIIGRRTHMPHRGLERHLLAQRGLIGKFPLHAWTEIKLAVCDPKDASNEKSVEAHYTGERALHFCRAHLRLRMGRLEIVSAHWRGDGSLGIKQSRYNVVPQRLRSRIALGERP